MPERPICPHGHHQDTLAGENTVSLDLAELFRGATSQSQARTQPWSRERKWRCPRLVVTAFIGVSGLALVGLGLLIAANVRLRGERNDAVAQQRMAESKRDWAQRTLQEAERQRQCVERSYERTRAAIEQMLTGLDDEKLKDLPFLEDLQRDLRSGLDFSPPRRADDR